LRGSGKHIKVVEEFVDIRLKKSAHSLHLQIIVGREFHTGIAVYATQRIVEFSALSRFDQFLKRRCRFNQDGQLCGFFVSPVGDTYISNSGTVLLENLKRGVDGFLEIRGQVMPGVGNLPDSKRTGARFGIPKGGKMLRK